MWPIYMAIRILKHSYIVDGHTLWTIPRQRQILNNAWPNCLPLCAILILEDPKRPCSSFHCPGDCFSIQCPVTAKYPSVFEACHASHMMILPETYLLWIYRRWQDLCKKLQNTHIKPVLEIIHLCLENWNDLFMSLLSIWNLDTTSSSRCNVNHVLKGWVFKSRNRL